jgi:hypothetical protein
MQSVTTTVFITRCWLKARLKDVLAYGLAAFACLLLVGAAQARTSVDLSELKVERADGALYLSAQLHFNLPTVVEDALSKGIPIYFVASAEVVRERWYWYDREMAMAQRYIRVIYQPLTRRWRLNTSAEPFGNTGLGVTLTQYYESQSEVLAAVQRIARWRIATLADLDHGGRQSVKFRFRLDAGQLPRTLQVGAVGETDWELFVERQIDVTAEVAR